MFANEIMTPTVISVGPQATVFEIMELMVSNGISAVPVIDDDRAVLGIVSEADLLHRPELGRIEPHLYGRWMKLFFGPERSAIRFIKFFGILADDVMTAPVLTVTEDTPSGEIARILDDQHIKRVPVVRDERLVGIISRRDLMKCIVARHRAPIGGRIDDDAIRRELIGRLNGETWATFLNANISVENGTVYLRGLVETGSQARALVVAAENVRGVRSVANHLRVMEPFNIYAS